MMVLFLVCFSWYVLLRPFLRWHRELFFGWNTVGANVGVSENPDKIPEYRRREWTNVQVNVTNDVRGDKESPKDCSYLKSCECFYTCPRAPFYRETKGLLHSESTLESKEYS
jgi:hypothetical protein